MRRLLVVVTSSALLAAASGCGDGGGADAPSTPAASSPAAAPVERAALDGQRFVAKQLTGRDLVAGTELSLEVDGARLVASAGCNTISGGFTLTGSALRFSDDPMVTQMACEPEAKMAQERWYADWLGAGVELAVDGDTLVATGGSVTATYRRAAATGGSAGRAPITGTDWELVSTAARGENDVALPSGVSAPTLRIDAGRATLFTGCNRGSARVDVRDDGFLTFDAVATTRKACPGDAGAIERQVLTVLKGEVAAAFDGEGRLSLAKDGARITYAAR